MEYFIEWLNTFLFVVGASFAYTFTKSKVDRREEKPAKEPEKPKETKINQKPVVQKYDNVYVPTQTRSQIIGEIYRYAVENNIESDKLRELLCDNETEIRVVRNDMNPLCDRHPRIYLDSKYGNYYLGRNGLQNMDVLYRQVEEGIITKDDMRQLMDF